jgi:hypothetical protein
MEERLKVLSKPVPLHRINYASLGFAGDARPVRHIYSHVRIQLSLFLLDSCFFQYHSSRIIQLVYLMLN